MQQPQEQEAPAQELQNAYALNNPYPPGEKQRLLKSSAAGLISYDDAHEPFQIFCESLVAQHHFYDVFLIDTRGNVVYSFFKERDFASNLQASNTALAQAYRAILRDPTTVFETEFEPYEPSNWALARFMTTGIVDIACTNLARAAASTDASSCKLLGVLAVQLPADFAAAQALSEFNAAKESVSKAMDTLWALHNNLIYVYRTSYSDLTVSQGTHCSLPFSVSGAVRLWHVHN